MRNVKLFEAINEAIDVSMAADTSVYLLGLGVPDPKGIFGTTLGLEEKYGSDRVMDMPTSENGMTGVALGTALVGMRPIIVHQRVEFALLAIDQMINQAAKWFYMSAGQNNIPLVIRLIIGRGWGQGPQHSQSLESWFAHIPGLKVVMPATPYDAKGLMIESIKDNNPVIFIEHRWLHNIQGDVPEGSYTVPLGKARIAKPGKDVTIVATSYMVLESLRCAEILAKIGVEAEVIDLRSLRPLDTETILVSVRKTGRLLAVDTGWTTCGISAEIISLVTESIFNDLKSAPQRTGILDLPIPSSPAIAQYVYPRANDLVKIIADMFSLAHNDIPFFEPSIPLDIPDSSFTGPF